MRPRLRPGPKAGRILRRLGFGLGIGLGLALSPPGLQIPVRAATGPPSPGEVGRRAPNFSRVDLDRRRITLADYRGKTVLLDFWATWCEPCLAEIPRFVAWQREYGAEGLRIVGVSMDDDAPPVRAAYRKYALNYPVAMGDEKIGELYGGILGLPVTFLIDAKGTIRFEHRGAVDPNQMQDEIRSLLQRR